MRRLSPLDGVSWGRHIPRMLPPMAPALWQGLSSDLEPGHRVSQCVASHGWLWEWQVWISWLLCIDGFTDRVTVTQFPSVNEAIGNFLICFSARVETTKSARNPPRFPNEYGDTLGSFPHSPPPPPSLPSICRPNALRSKAKCELSFVQASGRIPRIGWWGESDSGGRRDICRGRPIPVCHRMCVGRLYRTILSWDRMGLLTLAEASAALQWASCWSKEDCSMNWDSGASPGHLHEDICNNSLL